MTRSMTRIGHPRGLDKVHDPDRTMGHARARDDRISTKREGMVANDGAFTRARITKGDTCPVDP